MSKISNSTDKSQPELQQVKGSQDTNYFEWEDILCDDLREKFSLNDLYLVFNEEIEPEDELLQSYVQAEEDAVGRTEIDRARRNKIKHKLQRKAQRNEMFTWIWKRVSKASQSKIKKSNIYRPIFDKLSRELNIIGLKHLLRDFHCNDSIIEGANLLAAQEKLQALVQAESETIDDFSKRYLDCMDILLNQVPPDERQPYTRKADTKLALFKKLSSRFINFAETSDFKLAETVVDVLAAAETWFKYRVQIGREKLPVAVDDSVVASVHAGSKKKSRKNKKTRPFKGKKTLTTMTMENDQVDAYVASAYDYDSQDEIAFFDGKNLCLTVYESSGDRDVSSTKTDYEETSICDGSNVILMCDEVSSHSSLSDDLSTIEASTPAISKNSVGKTVSSKTTPSCTDDTQWLCPGCKDFSSAESSVCLGCFRTRDAYMYSLKKSPSEKVRLEKPSSPAARNLSSNFTGATAKSESSLSHTPSGIASRTVTKTPNNSIKTSVGVTAGASNRSAQTATNVQLLASMREVAAYFVASDADSEESYWANHLVQCLHRAILHR